jgi:hypothetical protein
MAAEARQLAGGTGASVFERLGLPVDAPPEQLWSQAASAIRRWRQQAQQPGQPANQRQAAQVVLRSCEAILQELAS